MTQKDTLNDDEFEPYLNTQARQVRKLILFIYLFIYFSRIVHSLETVAIVVFSNQSWNEQNKK